MTHSAPPPTKFGPHGAAQTKPAAAPARPTPPPPTKFGPQQPTAQTKRPAQSTTGVQFRLPPSHPLLRVHSPPSVVCALPPGQAKNIVQRMEPKTSPVEQMTQFLCKSKTEEKYASIELDNNFPLYSEFARKKAFQLHFHGNTTDVKKVKSKKEEILEKIEGEKKENEIVFGSNFVTHLKGEENGNSYRGLHMMSGMNGKLEILAKSATDKSGVYLAIAKQKNKKIDHAQPTTMFPDKWSVENIKKETLGSLTNPLEKKVLNFSFIGISPSKVVIAGYINGNNIDSAFPFYKGKDLSQLKPECEPLWKQIEET